MRLKLTVEYDGTGFRGWARAAGRAHGRGRAARGARRASTAASASSRSPGGPTPACTRSRTSSRSTSHGGPPAERAAEALNTVLPDDVAVVAAEEAADDFHARFDARVALVPLPHLAPARALAVRGASGRSGIRGRSTSTRSERRRAALLLGEHDFRAFTPTETQHDAFVRVGRARAAGSSSATTSSRSRSPPTRSCATWCGRSSARCSSGADELARAARGPRRAATRARPRRRTGLYLTERSATTRGRWLRSGDALPGRPLRSRRHRRRLRRRSSSRRCATRRRPCSGASSPTTS